MHRHLSRLISKHKVFVITEDNPKGRRLDLPCDGVRIPDQSRNILRRCLVKCGLDPIWTLLRAKQIQQQICNIVQKKKPDIILSVWHSPFLLAAFQTAKKKAIPFAVVIHDDWQEMIDRRQWSKPVLSKPLKKIFRGASKRICVSKSTAVSFQKKYGTHQCEILPPVPSAKKWQPERAAQGEHLRIATFGELMGNIEVLKSVSNVLAGTGATLTFFTHGQGPDRQELGGRPHVTDGGSLSAEDLVQHLARYFDVILIPQSFEPEQKYLVQRCFPSKIPEACQTGLPILTIGPEYGTAHGWAKEVMPPSLVLNSLDTQLISEAILSLKKWQFGKNPKKRFGKHKRLLILKVCTTGSSTSWKRSQIASRCETIYQAFIWETNLHCSGLMA